MSEFAAPTEPSPSVSGWCGQVWSYRYKAFVVVLLPVVSEREPRETNFLNFRRCWCFEWCHCFISAQGTLHSLFLRDQLVEAPVLTVDARQPSVVFTVRVDAISQPCADLLEARGLPVGLVAEKFGVIRIESKNYILVDLTTVHNNLLNERSQFLQEHLVTVKDFGELAFLQDAVIELMKNILQVLVQAAKEGGREVTHAFSSQIYLSRRRHSWKLGELINQFILLSRVGTNRNEPKIFWNARHVSSVQRILESEMISQKFEELIYKHATSSY